MKRIKAKIGRNAPCPCGSGLKYKKCCAGKQSLSPKALQAIYEKKHRIRFKTPEQVEGIRASGRLAIATLRKVQEMIAPGVTTDEINTLVHQFTIDNGAIPAPLNYNGFPKSVCVSVNEVVCHGIPGPRILHEGDIVNVDVTPILNGYYADMNQTYFVGEPSAEACKIVNVARESLRRGMAAVQPGNRLGDIGWAIQDYAESQGCSVVRQFIGHGVGLAFHEPPQVLHYGTPHTGLELLPDMVFTIEPMINLGGPEVKILDDNWTAVTADGSLTAQFEQTILVTEQGFESLTPF